MTTPRACWSALHDKAQTQCTALQRDMGALQQRLHSLHASAERLQRMQHDYRLSAHSQPGADSAHSGLQDAANQRQFLQQIDALLTQVRQDEHITQQALALTRSRWVQAEQERRKMAALQTQDQQRVRQAQQTLEQRRMDELGVRQFNLRLGGHA